MPLPDADVTGMRHCQSSVQELLKAENSSDVISLARMKGPVITDRLLLTRPLRSRSVA